MDLSDLGTTPLTDGPDLTARAAEATEYLEYLRGLIDDPEVYGFAVSTLEGIAETITRTERVTDGQRRAVRNIVAGAQEGQERRAAGRSSRRYEGYE